MLPYPVLPHARYGVKRDRGGGGAAKRGPPGARCQFVPRGPIWYLLCMRPKRGPPLRSQGHCFSRPQVTRSLFFMRKLKQHRSQVVFLNCRGRAVALKMAPGRRSRKTPLGPLVSVRSIIFVSICMVKFPFATYVRQKNPSNPYMLGYCLFPRAEWEHPGQNGDDAPVGPLLP